jgi:predicted NBD/HSP70 family sugar kinase
MRSSLSAELRGRLVGIGISLPDDIESWPLRERQRAASRSWTELNVEETVGRFSDLPVYLQNDVTAAAGAELLFGAARELDDFAYFYVGYRSASRLVLNHHVYAGRKARNTPAPSGETIATIEDLEAMLVAAGLDAEPLSSSPESWPDFGAPLEAWLAKAADDLAASILSMLAFVDVDRVIIDGRMPVAVCERLAALVRDRADLAGFRKGEDPFVVATRTGPFSKTLGAASLPFHSRFMVEQVGLTA